MKVYLDLRDWWIGYYRGDDHHYVCVLPTVVVRWQRGGSLRDRPRRRGYARILNVESAGMSKIAYVEAAGPRWLAVRLAWWAITHTGWIGPFDRNSRRVRTTERTGRMRYRFHIAFTAVPR